MGKKCVDEISNSTWQFGVQPNIKLGRINGVYDDWTLVLVKHNIHIFN